MNRRDAIYLGFLVWLFALGIGDLFIARYFGRQGIVVSDFVNIIAYVVVCLLWCIHDARIRGIDPPSRSMRFIMVLLLPVGLGLYVFKTRPAGEATLTFFAFIAGAVLAAIGGTLLGEKLLAAI